MSKVWPMRMRDKAWNTFVLLGLAAVIFFFYRAVWHGDSNPRPMPSLTKVEADMAAMPARSLILMKDGKFLLASRISTDDRPYTLDVLDSPGGQWKRVEFDEAKRREVVGIAYPNQGMQYETQAAKFLGQ